MAYFKNTPIYYNNNNQAFVNQDKYYNDDHEYYYNNDELEIIHPKPIELHNFDYFHQWTSNLKKEATAQDFLMRFNNNDNEDLFKDFDGVHYMEREEAEGEELSNATKRNSYFSDMTDDTTSDDDGYMNDDTFSVPATNSPNEYNFNLQQQQQQEQEQQGHQTSVYDNAEFDFEVPLVQNFTLSAEERYRIQMRQHYERRLRDIQQDFEDQMIEQEVVGLFDEWHLDDDDQSTKY